MSLPAVLQCGTLAFLLAISGISSAQERSVTLDSVQARKKIDSTSGTHSVGPIGLVGGSFLHDRPPDNWHATFRFSWAAGARWLYHMSESEAVYTDLLYEKRALDLEQDDGGVYTNFRTEYLSISVGYRWHILTAGFAASLPTALQRTHGASGNVAVYEDQASALATVYSLRLGLSQHLIGLESEDIHLNAEAAYPLSPTFREPPQLYPSGVLETLDRSRQVFFHIGMMFQHRL